MKRLMLILAMVGILAGGIAAPSGLDKGKKPAPTGSFKLVMVDDKNANGLPNWNDAVTFDVASTNAQYTFVDLKCYQNDTLILYVSHQIPGYYFTPTYYLKGYYWVPGAADCDARLYTAKYDMTNQVTLATMNIPVAT